KLAISGKAVSVRSHHRGIGGDHLNAMFDLTNGDILPVFVSAEVREGEPVGDLQGILVLCRKGHAAQDTGQYHNDHNHRGWASRHGSLPRLTICKSNSLPEAELMAASQRLLCAFTQVTSAVVPVF